MSSGRSEHLRNCEEGRFLEETAKFAAIRCRETEIYEIGNGGNDERGAVWIHLIHGRRKHDVCGYPIGGGVSVLSLWAAGPNRKRRLSAGWWKRTVRD